MRDQQPVQMQRMSDHGAPIPSQYIDNATPTHKSWWKRDGGKILRAGNQEACCLRRHWDNDLMKFQQPGRVNKAYTMTKFSMPMW